MQIDFNLVGAFALVMGGFGYYVRMTIKSSISDLKDTLSLLYVARNELDIQIDALTRRLETIEARLLGQQQNHGGGTHAS